MVGIPAEPMRIRWSVREDLLGPAGRHQPLAKNFRTAESTIWGDVRIPEGASVSRWAYVVLALTRVSSSNDFNGGTCQPRRLLQDRSPSLIPWARGLVIDYNAPNGVQVKSGLRS